MRERIRYIAEQATVAAGYSAQMQRHVIRPLREHISQRFLDGEEIAFSGRHPRSVARCSASPVSTQHFMRRTDIVSGMIEYAGD